ncbi:MAG: hypothetical protein MI923_03230, partial [Phycisphaerales bacterium]|nr:hypothetical protein [Phycisphaerales bacterium]
MIGKRVVAVEIRVRRVGHLAVGGVDRRSSVGRRDRDGHAGRIEVAVRVVVVGQHVDDDGRVFIGVGVVVPSHRWQGIGRRRVVTGIADPVAVGIFLIGVGRVGTIVGIVVDAVAVRIGRHGIGSRSHGVLKQTQQRQDQQDDRADHDAGQPEDAEDEARIELGGAVLDQVLLEFDQFGIGGEVGLGALRLGSNLARRDLRGRAPLEAGGGRQQGDLLGVGIEMEGSTLAVAREGELGDAHGRATADVSSARLFRLTVGINEVELTAGAIDVDGDGACELTSVECLADGMIGRQGNAFDLPRCGVLRREHSLAATAGPVVEIQDQQYAKDGFDLRKKTTVVFSH